VCNVSLFMDNFERKLSGMWDDYLVSPSIWLLLLFIQ
jgi:hypothetical protein